MGKVRKSWREHLNASEDELRETLRPLRVVPRYFDMKTRSDLLAIRLHAVGLAPVADHSRANIYDDLIKKVHQAGRVRFTRDELQADLRGGASLEIVAFEELDRGNVRHSELHAMGRTHGGRDQPHAVSRASFRYRQILSPSLWADKVVPEVRQFLAELKPGRS